MAVAYPLASTRCRLSEGAPSVRAARLNSYQLIYCCFRLWQPFMNRRFKFRATVIFSPFRYERSS